jgi:hypothetical protein
MPGVVRDPGQPLDHLGHPRQRPQVGGKPARAGASEQRLLHLSELLAGHLRGPARSTPAAQRRFAALLPDPRPAAYVAPVGAQLTGDLGLGDLTGEQLSSSKAQLFLGVTVAARAPTRPPTARHRHHPRILAHQHEHVCLYREAL